MKLFDPIFRISKTDKGWISEILIPKWGLFGIKYKWTHLISVTGISAEPWYFSEKKYAEIETIRYIENYLIDNYYNNKN